MNAKNLSELLFKSRRKSWSIHGKKIFFSVPGSFTFLGNKGRFPIISLTGEQCLLQCKHCSGQLLRTMLPVLEPQKLLELGYKFKKQGQYGFLISGGSDCQGCLPWDIFIDVISRIIKETNLIVTAHISRIDFDTARKLKDAGIRQVLVDLVGNESTVRKIFGLSDGLRGQKRTLKILNKVGFEIVPHVIMGLDEGNFLGEDKILEVLQNFNFKKVVFVIMMSLKGTSFENIKPPSLKRVGYFFCRAREKLPLIFHHLGCTRAFGNYRRKLDILAIEAGLNVLANPSLLALEKAEELGLEIVRRDYCCSIIK